MVRLRKVRINVRGDDACQENAHAYGSFLHVDERGYGVPCLPSETCVRADGVRHEHGYAHVSLPHARVDARAVQ